MNRVCIIMDKNGEFSGMASDEEIELFIVQPSCGRDPVYKYQSGVTGPQHVHALIGNHMVGHADDDMLDGGNGYGKLKPSRTTLKPVPK